MRSSLPASGISATVRSVLPVGRTRHCEPGHELGGETQNTVKSAFGLDRKPESCWGPIRPPPSTGSGFFVMKTVSKAQKVPTAPKPKRPAQDDRSFDGYGPIFDAAEALAKREGLPN